MRIEYYRIGATGPLPEIAFEPPFKVAFVADIAADAKRHEGVARWLDQSGARYFCAWGVQCSQWHDAVDWAQIEAWPDDMPDDQFCMTTWHENEPIEDMMYFARACSGYYDGSWNDRIAIIHLSATEDRIRLIDLMTKSTD